MVSKYESLNDLSVTQLRIYDIITNPENLTKPIYEKVILADVDKKTFRKWTNDKEFMGFVNKQQKELLFNDRYQAYQALAETSKIVGREGDVARKMLFELSGDYSEKLEVTGNVGKTIIITDFKSKSGERDEDFGTTID